jgi:hypothetical protein
VRERVQGVHAGEDRGADERGQETDGLESLRDLGSGTRGCVSEMDGSAEDLAEAVAKGSGGVPGGLDPEHGCLDGGGQQRLHSGRHDTGFNYSRGPAISWIGDPIDRQAIQADIARAEELLRAFALSNGLSGGLEAMHIDRIEIFGTKQAFDARLVAASHLPSKTRLPASYCWRCRWRRTVRLQ